MPTVAGLTGKVKFVAENKVQYRVETLLGGAKTGWKQHFNTKEKAMKFIKEEHEFNQEIGSDAQYLVTEVVTKTLGVF